MSALPVRIGVVGCGAVAQRLYRRPLQRLAKQGLVQVTALVDPAERHTAEMAGAFGQATRYLDLDAALAARGMDLALVLTPAHLHTAHAIAAIEHGVDVLCEKPMASTAADCARMEQAAGSAGRMLAIGMIRRFFPAFAELKQIIESGRLGTIRSFEYREGHKFEWDVTTPAAFRPRADGGTGVLFDIGPHAVDILAWLFGPLAVRAYADDALGGVDVNLSMDLEAGPVRGAMHLSWDFPQTNELRVLGSEAEAVLRVDQFDQLAVGRPGRFERSPVTVSFPADLAPEPKSRITPRSYADAMFCQLVQALRSRAFGEPPAVSATAGHAVVALLESAVSMSTPLPMPWLTPQEDDAYHRMHWSRTR